MDSLAGEAPPGSAGLLFHPYLQGERGPYWDPRLRADFIGLTFQHDGRHFARACYEGIAYSIRDLLESSDAGREDFEEILILGGGAQSALWRQIICDVLGLEISRPAHGDASFGAALLAGVGAGIFASPEDAAGRCAKVADRVQPDETRHALYSQLFSIYKEAQARLAPLDHKLHNLFADAGGTS
jgi:xylulokinase